MLQRYDDIIQDQLMQGIEGKEFYLPHIVYDGSARSSKAAPSLNECLETGPPLQNKLWSVLMRNRFHPVVLAGDLKQAFLQVRIREEDRDVMRFHWLKDLQTKQVEILRFTRALWLSTSPFLLGGAIGQHLRNLQQTFPNEVEEIRRSLYVHNVITGAENCHRHSTLTNSSGYFQRREIPAAQMAFKCAIPRTGTLLREGNRRTSNH